MERTFSARAANLTFTLDFHELLRGDLAPGKTVRLRYEPLRIVPKDEGYVFGDPTRPVTAHARFGGRDQIELVLTSSVGMQPDRTPDPTGDGNMLVATLDVPLDARELELWFSFESRSHGTIYDSDYGVNFHFGFARHQIEVIGADVRTSKGQGAFKLEVRAVVDVDRVAARIHSAELGSFPSFDLELEPSKNSSGEWRNWLAANIPVPAGAKVRFKLYYWIGGIRYKEDNDGLYYLAPPPPREVVQPPPAEIGIAAKSWA
jgi:hypothetical protein